jgi:predicted dehydrogenase
MGLRHARVLASLPDRFELVGGYDPSDDALGPPHLPRLAGEAEAVACAELVVVASPTHAHAATLARALAAGRHVLVEKPMCATFAEAQAIAAAFGRGPARLFVGHSERFNPVVRALARLLRRERVLAIDLHRAGPSRAADCGVLVNLGVHDFDLAAYLAGGSVTIRAAVGGDDFAHVLFETSSRTVGHLYVDSTVHAKRRSIAIATPAWTYDGDLLAPRLLRTPRGVGAATGHVNASEVPLPLEEPLLAQAIALADALDGAAHREIATGAEGARSVELAEHAAAACASAAENLSLFARP